MRSTINIFIFYTPMMRKWTRVVAGSNKSESLCCAGGVKCPGPRMDQKRSTGSPGAKPHMPHQARC